MLEYGLLTVTCSSVLILLVEILQLSGFEYPISYVKRRDKVCRIHSVSYADFNTADIIQIMGDRFRMNSLILGILESSPFEER